MMIGRKTEYTQLQHSWKQSTTKQGQCTLLVGPAGFGKTTLIHHFLETLQSSECLVLCGNAYSPYNDLFYAPIVESLAQHLGTLEAKERGDLCRGLEQLEAWFPGLFGSSSGSLQHPEPLMLFRCFAQLFERLAAQRPLCLVLEDLHWADTATQTLVHYLAQHFCRQGMMLLCSMRNEALEEDFEFRKLIGSLARLPHTQKIELKPLSQEEQKSLAAEYLSAMPSGPLSDALAYYTGGSPFYLCALLDTLRQEEGLFFDGVEWRFATSKLPLPRSIHDLVRDRIEQIPQEEGTLLQWFAVSPQAIRVADLKQLTQLSEEALLPSLQRLCRLGLLKEVLVGEEDGYWWVHPLFQQGLYELLPAVLKRRIHASFAERLEQMPPPPSSMRLAYHYRQMGPHAFHPRALECLLEAGAIALGQQAFVEAERYLLAALSVAQAIAAQSTSHAQALMALGKVWHLQGKGEKAFETLSEALCMYELQKHPLGMAEVHQTLSHLHWGRMEFEEAQEHLRKGIEGLDPSMHSECWERLQTDRLVFFDRLYEFDALKQLIQELQHASHQHQFSSFFRVAVGIIAFGGLLRQGDYHAAAEMIQTLIPEAKASNDIVQLVRVQNFAGLSYIARGLHAQAEHCYQTNLALVREHGLLWCEPSVLGLGGLAALLAGNWEDAQQRTLQGIQISKRIKLDRYLLRMYALQVYIYAWKGQYTQAEEVLQQAYKIPQTQFDDIHMAASLWLTESIYALETGQYERAEQLLNKLPQTGGVRTDSTLATMFLINWGFLHITRGDISSLEALTAEFLHRAEPGDYCAAWASYFQGQIALLRECPCDALEKFEEAAVRFEEHRVPFDAARAWLAWLRCPVSKLSEESKQLWRMRAEACLETFRTLGAQRYIQEAGELLQSPWNSFSADENLCLSTREAEVVALLARGMTNKDIAKTLHISPHTVGTHLKRIYTRFRLHSRTELIHFAHQRGLLTQPP